MIRHIVFFSMKPEALERDGLANAHAMAEHFRRISKEIPGVYSVELGLNYNSEERFYEMALNQVFESRQALTDYHHVCFDRLQRYKVIKQADVLLLMTRLPQLFTAEEKNTAWKDFEPICLHDSTLSFASHALFALQNGLTEQGMDYLKKALLLDLRDVIGNTGHEGLHLACMGEAWQAAECLIHL